LGGRKINWEWLINVMEKEASNAPVFMVEKVLKSKHDIYKLIFVVLSSRTKDEMTIKALKKLTDKYKNPRDLAKADVKTIEHLIYGVGFYKTKAKRIKEIATILCKNKCVVPKSYEKLIKLPGVGRKTANVALNLIHGKKTIGVDTHVHRIANRLGIVNTKTPKETEERLKKVVERKYWGKINRAFVAYGQTICKPKKPKCRICGLKTICSYYKKLKGSNMI